MKMKARSFVVLSLLLLVFIWGHSMIPAYGSGRESGYVLELLMKIIDRLYLPFNITDHMLRKFAHAAEHAAAGMLLGFYIYPKAFSAEDKLYKRVCLAIPPSAGFCIGFIDETIQLFTGRGALISDVWIDFFGVLCGTAFSYIIVCLIFRKKKRL